MAFSAGCEIGRYGLKIRACKVSGKKMRPEGVRYHKKDLLSLVCTDHLTYSIIDAVKIRGR